MSLREETNQNIKIEILTLYYAIKDKRTPFIAKVVCFLTCAYALSPIDLIPDFIPIIGHIDDIVIVPIGLWLSKRLIPSLLWQEIKENIIKQDSNSQHSFKFAITVTIMSWIIFAFILYKIIKFFTFHNSY